MRSEAKPQPPRTPIAAFLLAASLGLVALGAAAADSDAPTPAAAPTDASGVAIARAAFCTEKSGLTCNAAPADGARIAMDALPTDADGNRILYFHSVQAMPAGAALVHVWETRDAVARPQAKIHLSEQAKSLGDAALATLRSFLEAREAPAFAVVVRNFGAHAPRLRAYSQRIVHAPGTYTAYVATARGEILPNGAARTITIE